MPTLDQLIQSKRVLICVGPGGVGKTTTSAALALRGAMMGRRTLVLTVDPAQRLANSLGLSSFDTEEQQIDVPAALSPGENVVFHAMMLDTKRTFDAVIEKNAPNPEVRDRILNSKFYKQASTRLAGSQEYMAMEKLFELHQSRRYDLIVLDTPPTAHALDFLDAPARLQDFLGVSTDGLLARSKRRLGRLGLGFLKFNATVLRGVSKFVGADTFVGILNFLDDFKEMYGGFKSRAAAVKRLMGSPEVGFIVLTGPDRSSVDEGLFFHRRLLSENMLPSAFVMNRFRRSFGETDAEVFRTHFSQSAAAKDTQPEIVASLATQAVEALRQYKLLVDKDEREFARLKLMLGERNAPVAVPDFPNDIHDLSGLHEYGRHLTGA